MGLISSVSYLEPGRFSRSPVHSAVMDKDRRWLSYFVQDMLHLKRLAVHGAMSSDSLDVNEIRVKGLLRRSIIWILRGMPAFRIPKWRPIKTFAS
ncbi:Uncharacterised protein [Klebsiella pneumoniae subsp. pneumoniae]|uniref:Uncharacterized protein n=1 Tax=Klebsiella pneumoniae subsp. pneumoniae TaxID=72407 RepID=A0A377Z5D5_KLEPN|nr:Uncharacterised protein [Klebsiella pneumoniae subsp. pneumoniae]